MARPFPPPLSAPGAKPKAVEVTAVSVEPEKPVQPATEPGKVVISPEMVNYRTAFEVCKNCVHMGADGNCAVIEMTVDPNDSCNAYAEREDGASDMEELEEPEAMEQIEQ